MLNVIENGARIATPWYAVFPPRGTERLTPGAAKRPISEHDQSRESQLPHPNVGEKAYKQVEDASEERRKVAIAKEIMSTEVKTLPGNADLLSAWSDFQRYSIRHMPVVNELKNLIGIISDRDILKAWANLASDNRNTIATLKVSNIMNVRVLTGAPDTNLREMADAMTVHHVGAIPVLNDKSHIVGIVTRSDILRTIVNQAPVDLWS